MIELTKNTRQKDDQPFTELLNRFRTASQTEGDIQCIQSSLFSRPAVSCTLLSNSIRLR